MALSPSSNRLCLSRRPSFYRTATMGMERNSAFTAIRRGQRVAIRTKQAEVLQSVIPVVSIHMIELERDRLPAPRCKSTSGTAFFEQACTQKAPFKLERLNRCDIFQVILERPFRGKLFSTTPSPAIEVRCIDVESPQSVPQNVVISAIRRGSEFLENLPHRRRCPDGIRERLARIGKSIH